MGKGLLHSTQIPIANDVFSPSSNEISWAEKVVGAYEEASQRGVRAIRVDGQLVDGVHYKQAKSILKKNR